MGTNGAYLEQVANFTELGNHPAAAPGGMMMVNTEWGAFNNAREVLPTTPFDSKVDCELIIPCFQVYEKFISGMYLGEIRRNLLLALVDATPKPILFNSKSTKRLSLMILIESAWCADAPREKDSGWLGLGLRGRRARRFSGSVQFLNTICEGADCACDAALLE